MHWQYWFRRISTSTEPQSSRGTSSSIASTLAQIHRVLSRPETHISATTSARMSPTHVGRLSLQSWATTAPAKVAATIAVNDRLNLIMNE